MARGKRIREKGKLRLSHYFKNIEDGATVAIIKERGVKSSFPERLQGQCGKIEGSRGRFKLVKVNDGRGTKTFIIHPIHLRKL